MKSSNAPQNQVGNSNALGDYRGAFRFILLAVTIGSFGWSSASAEEGEAAKPRPTEVVVIKRKSSFEPQIALRNPFWPIGWTPGEAGPQDSTTRNAPTTQAVPVILDLPANQFVVSSILMAEPRLAVINGREYAEGDKIKTVLDGVAVDDAMIKSISDGVILIEFRKKLYRYKIRIKGS